MCRPSGHTNVSCVAAKCLWDVHKGRETIARMKAILLLLALASPLSITGQQLDVKIVQRQTSETGYTYQVAGHTNSYTKDHANCHENSYGKSATEHCVATSTTNTTTTAPMVNSYTVTGATLSLLLPDGRVIVVNCASKLNMTFGQTGGSRRSCRIPIVDDIRADFKGKNSKLSWPVSLDGKKFESETYTILSVLPAEAPATTND